MWVELRVKPDEFCMVTELVGLTHQCPNAARSVRTATHVQPFTFNRRCSCSSSSVTAVFAVLMINSLKLPDDLKIC